MVDGHTVLRFASDIFTDTVVRFAQTISGRRVQPFFDSRSPVGFSDSDECVSDSCSLFTYKKLKGRRPDTRPVRFKLFLRAIFF